MDALILFIEILAEGMSRFVRGLSAEEIFEKFSFHIRLILGGY
jgi:hypothetical protein